MATQPSDPDLPHLLAELQSDIMQRRYAAAEALAATKLDTPEVVNALKAAADMDKSRYVREAALNALNALGPAVSDLKAYTAPPVVGKPVKPLTRNQKVIEFTLAFVGWYVIIGLLSLVFTHRPGDPPLPDDYGFIFWGYCILPAQVTGLFVLVFARQWMGLGMLAAVALNILITLILGVGDKGWFLVPFWPL